MSLTKFKTVSGREVELDTSEKACSKFQIPDKNQRMAPAKYGMKVIHPCEVGEGIILGVGPISDGSPNLVLWAKFEQDEGRVCYSDPIWFVRA